MDKAQKRIYNREYKNANRERINAQRRDRYAANPQREIIKVNAWKASNPEKRQAGQAKYREANRERLRGYMRERYKQKRDDILAYAKAWKLKNRDKYRDAYLRDEYGIGLEEYLRMLDSQGGGCAICGGVDSIPLAVDHCHARGHVRGLLCSSCNNGLGRFKDDPQRLMRAAAYIQGTMDRLVQP